MFVYTFALGLIQKLACAAVAVFGPIGYAISTAPSRRRARRLERARRKREAERRKMVNEVLEDSAEFCPDLRMRMYR